MSRATARNSGGVRYSPFRVWLREEIRSCGKQVLEFAADSGLSRHICSTHSRQFDPCLESIMLACETLSIWKQISFEQQVLEALRHCVHYQNSSTRSYLTLRKISKISGCEERAQLQELGAQQYRSS
tara:strand:+ start:248 stop:628 length:381 start_codon:yes stop_codon:yes gene_type:complete